MALLDRRLHPASLLPLYLHNDALVRFIASPVTTPLIRACLPVLRIPPPLTLLLAVYVADHARDLLMRDSALVASLHPCASSGASSDAISITPSEASASCTSPARLPDLGIWLAQLAKQSGAATATIMVATVYIRRVRLALPLGATRLASAFHRVLLAALVLAAKMTHDRALKNAVWARYSGLFTTHDVNLMESQFLRLIDYNLCIDEPELLAVCAPLMISLGYSEDELHCLPQRPLSSVATLSHMADALNSHWRPWSHQPLAHTRTVSDPNVTKLGSRAAGPATPLYSRSIGLRKMRAQTMFLSHQATETPSEELGLGPPMSEDVCDDSGSSIYSESSESNAAHVTHPPPRPHSEPFSPGLPTPGLWATGLCQRRRRSSTSTLTSDLLTPSDGPDVDSYLTYKPSGPRTSRVNHTTTPYAPDCPIDVASAHYAGSDPSSSTILRPEHLVLEANIDDTSPVLPSTPHMPLAAAPTSAPVPTPAPATTLAIDSFDQADSAALTSWSKIFPDPPLHMPTESSATDVPPNDGSTVRTSKALKANKIRRQLSFSTLLSSFTHSAAAPVSPAPGPGAVAPKATTTYMASWDTDVELPRSAPPADPAFPASTSAYPSPWSPVPAQQDTNSATPRLKTARSMPLLKMRGRLVGSRISTSTSCAAVSTVRPAGTQHPHAGASIAPGAQLAPSAASTSVPPAAARFALRRAKNLAETPERQQRLAHHPHQREQRERGPGLRARASALCLRSASKLRSFVTAHPLA